MKETLKERAYNYIKEKIITCEYKPGILLNEDILKNEMEMSRTPIRDATSRLEQENLVKIFPKKGIMVSPLSVSDINAITEVRFLLEPYVIQKYGERINEEEYRRFYQLFSMKVSEVEKGQSMYEWDNEFHYRFIQASENDFLISLYEHIKDQDRRVRILSGERSEKRLQQTQEEHMVIVQHCLRKDWEQAANAMKVHLDMSRRTAFEAIMQNGDIQL